MTESVAEPVSEPVVPVNETVVSQISSQLSDVTADQIHSVLSAWNLVIAGAVAGTVLRDPATGFVAHRVTDSGVPVWRCSSPDGTLWNDMQPTLPWDVLYSPDSSGGAA